MNYKFSKIDYKYGKMKEEEIKDILACFFNCDLVCTDEKCIYDFIDEQKKIIIELKSRRVTHNKYDTTLLDAAKIKNYKRLEQYKKYFVFCFSDKIYYIDYDKIIKNNYKIKKCFLKRGYYINNYNIPIKDLNLINGN